MVSFYNNWINELNKYAKVLVDEEMFISRIKAVRSEIKKVEEYNNLENFEIINQVKNNLKDIKSQSISILAGGGIDSNLLILLTNKIFPKDDIRIYSIETKDNSQDIKELLKLSKELKLKHYIYTLKDNDIKESLDYFYKKYQRYPRDEAYPAIFKIVKEGKDNQENIIFLDGQYADTYTFSNPQNVYQLIWRRLPNLNFDKLKLMRKSSKIFSLFLGLFTNNIEFLLYFCRIEDTYLIRKFLKNLLNETNLDFEVVFQIIFKEILLFYREEDKYRVPSKIFSPFKDEKLFIHASQNLNIYRSIFKKKKPIYRYIRSNFKKFKIKSYERSFKVKSDLQNMQIP